MRATSRPTNKIAVKPPQNLRPFNFLWLSIISEYNYNYYCEEYARKEINLLVNVIEI
jgi:hypothetical protein